MRSSEGSSAPAGRTDPVIVALPGTGSDADYVQRAFAGNGCEVIAVEPSADGLIRGYRRALDEAARNQRIIAAGVSIGACVAVQWALDHPDRCDGVLAALPPWLGAPDLAPAAHSAAWTVELLRTQGLEATIHQMQADSPSWLAAELSRSWRSTGPHLVAMLREATTYQAPTAEMVARLRVPLSIVAVSDDPVHPIEVARTWRAAAPSATSTEISMTEWGADPSVLGRTTVAGWRALFSD
jgi:pimeloyl-ACP methyl ester carboxylesterase